MNFAPLYDRLLVKRIEVPTESEGGLHIPDVAREKAQEGVVLRTGPGRMWREAKEPIPLQVKEGDHIMFGRFSGTEIMIDGEEHLILREDEILGVLSEGNLKLDQYLSPTT
jgi:chaperonin GroES